MFLRKAGLGILTVWCGFQVLLAAGIVGAMTFLGANAPAISVFLTPAQLAAVDPAILGVMNSIAILANALIVALCGLVLVVVWKEVARGSRWALHAVSAALLFVQLCGFASDRYLQHRNLVLNLVSTGILVAGLALCQRARLLPNPERL